MTRADQLLKELYLKPLKASPEVYIGIELEFPIVSLDDRATDIRVTKGMMEHLVRELQFKAEKQDEDGSPVQLVNAAGDRILFEVSYNTLEFAFAKAKTIQEVDRRFDSYMGSIQDYLREYNHEIQGHGIHPRWYLNDNQAVKLPRYQMLLKYLALSETRQDSLCHHYPQYGSFICGNQVQLDVSRTNYLRVLNAFNQIEAVKAFLFANSEFPEEDWDTKISRDVFWENSMHGILTENVGVYHKLFQSEQDFFDHLTQTAMFTAERGQEIYYFEPIKAGEYLEQSSVSAYNLNGELVKLLPSQDDFQWHRSYQYQTLTKRATVEFRSVCTQPLDRTFAPTAFHVGLLANLDELEKCLKEYPFLSNYGHRYKQLRRLFSKKSLAVQDQEAITDFARLILRCAVEGLKKRGQGEEVYLSCFHPLSPRF